MGQTSEDDNGSAKGSSRKTIPKSLQVLARDDTLSESKDVQLLDSQKTSENLSAIGIEDLVKVDVLPNNEEFGKEKKLLLRLSS